MRWWHVTISSVRRAHLFPEEAERRRAVECIARVAGRRLLLFCVVDDHLHVVVACGLREVGHVRRALALALSTLAGDKLVSHARPIESRAHLNRLVRYLLTQVVHHGLDQHPALYSGSCFQDLIGARRISGFATLVARELPRLRQEELYAMVGLPRTKLSPLAPDVVRSAGVTRIASAAAAAIAADPALTGRSSRDVLARRITARVAVDVGITRRELRWSLRITSQRIGQLLASPLDLQLVRAAQLQLSLEHAVGHAAQGTR